MSAETKESTTVSRSHGEEPIGTDDYVDYSHEAGSANTTPVGGSSGPKMRKHGKGFVYIGLSDCDDALRKIDSHAKTMSIDQFARSLGHKQPKGRFLHKLDSLKAFGLIQSDTSDSVTLTQLAEDMLYGAAKTQAKTTAFLNYAEFKKVFVDFPKGQDNDRNDVVNFVKAKLGIVNEVDRFIRLFLESAEYAGLLDGTADTASKLIRLRPAPQGMNGAAAEAPVQADAVFSVIPADEVDDLLDAAGLTNFKQHAEVRQRTTGKFTLKVGEGGKITIEISRPVQIIVRPQNLLTDLPIILEAMGQKGLEA